MALTSPISKKVERNLLAQAHSHYYVPLVALSVVRIIIAFAFVVEIIAANYSLWIAFIAGFIMIFLILRVFSTQIRTRMLNIQQKFMNNLNERDLRKSGKNNSVVSDLHLAYMHVGADSAFIGERLMDTDLSSRYGVNVVNIQRGSTFIPVPAGDARLFPGDVIGVVGTEDQIADLIPMMERESPEQSGSGPEDFEIGSVTLSGDSPILGLSVAQADLRRNYSSSILAVQRNDDYITDFSSLYFTPGDRIWLVGDKKIYCKLA